MAKQAIKSVTPRTSHSRQVQKQLQHDRVVTTALELAERAGTAALTMRRLAEELEVDPAALYRIVRDKDELILAVGDRTIALTLEAIGEIAPDADWRTVLSTIADKMWETSARYPAISSMTFARVTGGPAERQMVELILRTISGLGLSPADTVRHYRAFADAALSMCGQNATLRTLDPIIREKDATSWSRIYTRLPLEEYPAARAHVIELGDIDERTVYDTVISGVLDAIAATVG